MRVNELIIKEQDRILIIAPHPDDESIGVGGLLCKYAEQCTVWVMTDGRYGNPQYSPTQMKEIRRLECMNAMKIAGVSSVFYMDYEDGTLIGHKECYDQLDLHSFTKVFLPNPFDNHSDHTAVYQYAIEKLHRENVQVFLYEVHTPLADISCYTDVSDVIKKKGKMVASYVSQMGIHPYDKQIYSLAEFRGLQNEQIGKMLETYQEVSCSETATISTGTEIELAKYKYFTRILSMLLKRNKEISIAELLEQNGYHTIAVYGYGVLGQRLVDDINSRICPILYIVDKNEKITSFDKNISVVHSIEEMKPVDIVVVTTYACEKIMDEIRERVGLNVMSLEEVLDLPSRKKGV